MKAGCDLLKMQARQNPYAAKLKKPVTTRLSEDVIGYFKKMVEEAGSKDQRERRLIEIPIHAKGTSQRQALLPFLKGGREGFSVPRIPQPNWRTCNLPSRSRLTQRRDHFDFAGDGLNEFLDAVTRVSLPTRNEQAHFLQQADILGDHRAISIEQL